MPKPGDVITNRLSGGRIEFLDTASSTGGELLRYRHLIRRPGTFAEGHVHPRQDETILVERGRVRVQIDDEVHEIGPGQSITIPRGKVHVPASIGDGEMLMQVEFRPALRMELWLEQLYGCCNFTGRRAGQLSVLQKLVWVNRYDMFAADHSLWSQRLASFVVTPTVARFYGYRPYSKQFAAAAYAAQPDFSAAGAARRVS